MKKIGIITFHHAKYSYGAILQTLALSMLCRKYSDDVEIVNYENPYEQKGAKTKDISVYEQIKRYANYFARMTVYGGFKNPYINSSNIDMIYDKVSSEVYHSVSEMNDLSFDILITGSDQVWNPEITGGIDKAFFLEFGTAEKYISYAPSVGSYCFSSSEKETLRKYLRKYSAVSVREEFAKEQLQPLCEQNIKVVPDPTLLIDKNSWIKKFSLKENAYEDKFILTFFVSSGIASYWPEISEYKKKFGLPVWNIQSHKHKPSFVDKVIFSPSAGEFLQLIINAELIITNSFHGTAFSLNFEKNFVPVISKSNPERVKNLLSQLGLGDIICDDKSCLVCPDYSKVSRDLAAIRKDSLDWFENAVKE